MWITPVTPAAHRFGERFTWLNSQWKLRAYPAQFWVEINTYEIEILDGTAVKRVLSVNTTSAVYTAAQQTADWGAPLAPGDTLDIRIFQLSALVGRGAPKTVTFTF